MFQWDNLYRSKWFGPCLGALLAALSGLLCFGLQIPVANTLKQKSYDFSFHLRPRVIPEELVLIYMDDASYEALNPSYGRWDRGMHAQLLDRMTSEGAKVVLFDVVFSGADANNLDADKHFEQAIEQNGNVILGADYVLGGTSTSMQQSEMLIPPYEPFDFACASIGFVQVKSDTDFMVREHYHRGSLNPQITSMTWESALWAESPYIKTEEDNHLSGGWINYYGEPLALPSVSYKQVLEVNGLPKGFFRDKVVIIGQNIRTLEGNERKDEFRNPYSARWLLNQSDLFMPGAEVHATILLNLMRGDWLRQIPVLYQALVFSLLGLVYGFTVCQCKPYRAVLISIVLMVCVILLSQLIFQQYRYWFPWLIVIAIQVPLGLAWSITFNAGQYYMQRQLLKQSLNHYLSPRLVKSFLSNKNEDFLKPGAQKKEVTILFSDIAGFTSASEGMDSDDLAFSMNHYFQCMVESGVHAEDGTVIKYIGDAIFALWNAPEEQEDHAYRACKAAIAMNAQNPTFGVGRPISTRIGLHTGVANVGNFGSDNRVDYTAIGENINLGARIEGLNKTLGTHMLMSDATQNELGKHDLHCRFLGRFKLSGFAKAFGIWHLMHADQQWMLEKSYSVRFEATLQLIEKGNIEEAINTLDSLRKEHEKDGVTAFYRTYCQKLLKQQKGDQPCEVFAIDEK